MRDQLVSFETAKLAKEKGFIIPVTSSWDDRGIYDSKLTTEKRLTDWNTECESIGLYSAPTQSLLQKWIREKHKIEMFVNPTGENPRKYMVIIPACYLKSEEENRQTGVFDTYEEALESGLQRALNLI